MKRLAAFILAAAGLVAQTPMQSPLALGAPFPTGPWIAYTPTTTHMSGGGLAAGTYTSGITATGTIGQTCTLGTFNGGGSAATATVALTGTNTIAGGTALVVTAAGTLYGTAPTSATAGSGTATCSGTATVATTLTAITSNSAYLQAGKTVFVRIMITSVSDGSNPFIQLPVPVLSQASLLQTINCAWANDGGVWVGAFFNPNINANNQGQVAQYNNVAPTTSVSHQYACNGVYQAQ